MSFHGCIHTGGTLAFGSVDETVRLVRDTLDIMKPGGGFALSPTHMIQDNTPLENVLALYETARQFGAYS